MAGEISTMPAATVLNSADLFEIVQGGTNKKLAASLLAARIGADNKFVAVIGDATNVNINVNHNLNTRNIHISIRRTVTPFDQAFVDNEATDANNVLVKFSGSPPAVNQWTVTVSR